MTPAAPRSSRDEVIAAYRLILGREPESDAVIDLHRSMTRHQLVAHFLNCPEGRLACPGILLDVELPKGVAPSQIFPGYSEADLRIFDAFPRAATEPQPGFVTDFLGNRTRTAFSSAFAGCDGQVFGHPVPGDHFADAAEWIGLLKTILHAGPRLRVAELGAGYGPWIVAAHTAARRRGIEDIRLYAVEANAAHLDFIRQNCRDNGIDPDAHVLLHAAVGAETGTAHWPVVEDAPFHYGLRPMEAGEPDYMGRRFAAHVEVPVIGLRDLLAREERWTLLHIDVQGTEAELCLAAADALDRQVEWLVIGTHSRAVDGALTALFHARGWVQENERPSRHSWSHGRSLEFMLSNDGTQVWRNPHLGPFVVP